MARKPYCYQILNFTHSDWFRTQNSPLLYAGPVKTHKTSQRNLIGFYFDIRHFAVKLESYKRKRERDKYITVNGSLQIAVYLCQV